MSMVSVIVPFYNTNKIYFERCISSIQASRYDSIEILIIDDGSDLEYVNYLNDFISIPNIKVFHQKNAGPSFSRNIGLKEASGDYILFIDSDDYISNDYISALVCCIEKYNADIAYSSMKTVNENGENVKISFKQNTINKHEFYLDLSLFGHKKFVAQMWKSEKYEMGYPLEEIWLSVSICGKLYRKTTINDMWFEERLVNGEDQIFTYDALMKSKIVAFTDKGCYFYLQNSNSIQHCVNEKIVEKYLNFIEAIKERIGDDNFVFWNKASYEMRTLYYLLAENLSIKEYKRLTQNIHEQKTAIQLRAKMKFRYAPLLDGKLMNLCIKKGWIIPIYFLRSLIKKLRN